MSNKKNYLKYYKKTYLNEKRINLKRNLIIFFIFLLFISMVVIFSIFVQIENTNEDYIDETSMAMNRAVSVKKKKLRTDFSVWNRYCDWNLMVVNNMNEIPEHFVKNLKQYGDIEVDEKIVSALEEMIHEANKNDAKLWVSSGYRTVERQKILFDKEVEKYLTEGLTKSDAIDLALKKVSLPQKNEHNMGFSVDFNAAGEEFVFTKEYEWLMQNSPEYGFILRYPQEKENITGRAFEPAHFRFVGEEHAKIITSRGLCLEEYVSSLMK